MGYVAALDQGTTSSRALIFDEEARCIAKAQRELTQHFPRPGEVEHDPLEIWSSQVGVLAEAMARASIDASELAGIGITNQRETTLLWDRKSGEPLCRAIVWQDRRTADLCDRLRAEGLEELIRSRTGLVLDPYFSGTKLLWMLANVPDARERMERGELAFGTVDSWLLYKLTGGALHVTEPSNASRTLLFDLELGDWSEEILSALAIPRSVLPEIRSSSEIYAEASTPAIVRGVPIAGIAGDQQAAMLGQLCTEPGLAKSTYGTGCFLLVNTGGDARASSQRLLTTALWQQDGAQQFALEGSIFVSGAIVQWLRDGLGIVRHAHEIESLAASVQDSGGVCLVPALTGLGAPHWDPDARGTIVGITRGTTAAHIARAALEGMAFQVAELLDAMELDAGGDIPELRVDGGAAANDLLMQLQADLLQRPVVRPQLLETTALGAAYLAGLATDVWPSLESLEQHWQIDKRFEPAMSASEAESAMTRWLEAIERSRGWAKR